jgi:SAM-dependent methyltransferase
MLFTEQHNRLDIFYRPPPLKRLLGMRTQQKLVADRDTNRLTPHVEPKYPHAATMYRVTPFVKFPLPLTDESEYKWPMSESLPPTPNTAQTAAQTIDETRAALHQGSVEMYEDAELYDHEFSRRRHDVAWYRQLAADMTSVHKRALSIVELASGTGRLLLPLVRDGHQLIGIDRSAQMLSRCQARLRALGKKAVGRALLLQADFRELPLHVEKNDRFRLIVCPFNGLQHLYHREDLERFLAEVRRLLHPDGIFAFDVLNPDLAWLSRSPTRRWSRTRFKHPRTGEKLIYSTNHDYDPATQIQWIRIFYEPDPATPKAQASAPRTIHLSQKLYFPAELTALLHYNGFRLWYRAGGFDGQPLSPVSVEQVICARVR